MVDLHFSDADLAELYDALCAGRGRADLDFYLPLVMAAGSVLDAGCGTGSLLSTARRRGHRGDLCGVDPAAGMIEVARRYRDIDWMLGNLGDFAAANTGRRFDLIVMTGHAFQALLEDAELRGSLGAIRALLAAQGRFVFETRNPAARDWETWPQKYAAEVVDRLGRPVRVSLRIETPFDGRVLSFTQTYTSPAWDKARVSRSTLRFLDSPALTSFLTEADLVVEQQFGDWDRTPVTDTSPEIITVARSG
jgi:SAM-dependent methyltransferase